MGIRKTYNVRCDTCLRDMLLDAPSIKAAAKMARKAGYTVTRTGRTFCGDERCIRARAMEGREPGLEPLPATETRDEVLTFPDGSRFRVPSYFRGKHKKSYTNACAKACDRQMIDNERTTE